MVKKLIKLNITTILLKSLPGQLANNITMRISIFKQNRARATYLIHLGTWVGYFEKNFQVLSEVLACLAWPSPLQLLPAWYVQYCHLKTWSEKYFAIYCVIMCGIKYGYCSSAKSAMGHHTKIMQELGRLVRLSINLHSYSSLVYPMIWTLKWKT